MFIPSAWDVEIRRAEIIVRKTRRQHWVYRGANGVAVTADNPGNVGKVSVRWMPIVGAVSVNYCERTASAPTVGSLGGAIL